MLLRPGLATTVGLTQARQEGRELLTAAHTCPYRIVARPHQIPDRFMGRIGQDNSNEVGQTMQPRNQQRAASVRLDSIGRARRHLRRCNNGAAVTLRRQLSVKTVAARSRLVGRRQFLRRATKAGKRLLDLLNIECHRVEEMRLVPRIGLRRRDRNRVLLCVQPNEETGTLVDGRFPRQLVQCPAASTVVDRQAPSAQPAISETDLCCPYLQGPSCLSASQVLRFHAAVASSLRCVARFCGFCGVNPISRSRCQQPTIAYSMSKRCLATAHALDGP